MKRIAIVGSLNMDFVVSVERLPSAGETVLGTQFQMVPGGKGANQAFAVARLCHDDCRAQMIGKVGYDIFADHLKASLSAAGVDVSTVHATRKQPTGTALITVNHAGENSIVVAAGANATLETADLDALRSVFRKSVYALFQLETPLDTVANGLRIALEEGVRTMLDPAPAQPLEPAMLPLIDVLTPNESEACKLIGREPERLTVEDAEAIARQLLRVGPQSVVIKLGEHGCFYLDSQQKMFVPGYRVVTRDTTAAGDTFNGALAVALAEGVPIDNALRFANAAAAISVTQAGAQSSIPNRADVEAFMAMS